MNRRAEQLDDDGRSGLPNGLNGIVADNEDPLHLGRVKVLIPAVSETEVCEKWIKPFPGSISRQGHGFASIPQRGVEVALWSRAGGKHELFYTTQFNEAGALPEDVPDESVACLRYPCDLKIICEGDLMLQAGRVLIKSEFGTVQISGAAGLIFSPVDDGGGA
ncbi:MAG TPA: phage baseplate assembly protein V [Pyrinomonadaceae bacterium]|jgi:hypothetical protein